METENSENNSVEEGQEKFDKPVENKVEPEQEKSIQPEPEKKAAKAQKIEIRLQAAGDAPIMKTKNYKVDGEKQISWILAFIRKYLKLEPQDNLFVYVNQAFSPSPDQTVTNLAECFGQDNKLVLYYSRSQAWG